MVPTRDYILMRIPRPEMTEIVKSRVQTAEEITECVESSVHNSLWYCGNYAPAFAYGNSSVLDTCYDIWCFMKENFIFNPETKHLQTGRSIRYIIHDPVQTSKLLDCVGERYGEKFFDCKHFSTFALATCKALGIDANLRLCSYSDTDPTPTHVYVVAKSKKGDEIIIDGTLSQFNRESKSKSVINVKEIYKFKLA